MTYAPPLGFRYEGDGAWSPYSPYVAKRANEHYAVGEVLLLVPHHERSQASHNHYFARVSELWQTLPEAAADDYPSSEHLRKKALIRCGFSTQTDYTFDTARDAITFAGIMAQEDEYCIVEVKGRVVRRWRAKSQSIPAMGKADFEASKQAVLDFSERLVAGANEDAA